MVLKTFMWTLSFIYFLTSNSGLTIDLPSPTLEGG